MTDEFSPANYPNLQKLQTALNAPLVFLDIETTGLNPEADAIIQIYAADIGTGEEYYATNLAPEKDRAISGIYNDGAGLRMHYKSGLLSSAFVYRLDDAEDGEHDIEKNEYDLLISFTRWLATRAEVGRDLCVVGGRNVASFDIPMLRHRVGTRCSAGILPVSHRVFDTTMVSMVEKMMQTEDKDHVTAHTAKADTFHELRVAEQFLARQWATKPMQTSLDFDSDDDDDAPTAREDLGY